MFVIVFILCMFAFLVSWASGLYQNTDFMYIAEGAAAAFIIFMVVDYIKLNTRIKYMKEFLDGNCGKDLRSNYPIDKTYGAEIKSIVDEHNKYRETTQTEHDSELEFITKWVHDVKVPISAIKLITENADDEISQMIDMQLNYIDQNIQMILFHMKAKRFYDDYKIRQASLESIVKQALKNYSVFFAYKSISLKLTLEDYYVNTDEKWSIYIVSQLISNAVKYTDSGGKISITAEKDDKETRLKIKNTGTGIQHNDLGNIFKRGYSGYSTRKEKSTGYGLYLSQKLAEKMGHQLSVESVYGEYAEFTLHYMANADKTHYKNVRYI